jgi:hypothetical protein
MCALCGVLGGAQHWTDAAPRPGVFTRNTDALSGATGRTEIIDHLAHLWSSAEAMIGRPCDPLDPALLDRLEAARE